MIEGVNMETKVNRNDTFSNDRRLVFELRNESSSKIKFAKFKIFLKLTKSLLLQIMNFETTNKMTK